MDWLKSSCGFSAATMASGEEGVVGVSLMSGHRVLAIEFGTAPFARFEHLAHMLHGMPHVLEAEVQRRETEAQDIRMPRAPGCGRVAGAEVADHAARDQRLHDRVGA